MTDCRREVAIHCPAGGGVRARCGGRWWVVAVIIITMTVIRICSDGGNGRELKKHSGSDGDGCT